MQNQRGDDEASQPERTDGEALDAEQLCADEYLFEPAADLSRCGGPGLGLNLGDGRLKAAGHHLGAEGGDEGRQVQAGDQVAVDQLERYACDQNGQQDGYDQGPALLERIAAQQRRTS